MEGEEEEYTCGKQKRREQRGRAKEDEESRGYDRMP